MTTAQQEFTSIDVELGKTLVENIGRSKWELGDLAIRVCPATNGDKAGRLVRFAAEIDIRPSTLDGYRFVATRWPLPARTGSSWSVHKELAHREDRFDIIAERDYWTVDALRDRLERRPTRFPPPPIDDDDDDEGLLDPSPPEPHPMEPLVEANRIAGRLHSIHQEILALKRQVIGDPVMTNKIVRIIRKPLDERIALELIETMEA